MTKKPETITQFEVVFLDEDGSLGSMMCSASMLAGLCSNIINDGMKIVGICRLGEGPQ